MTPDIAAAVRLAEKAKRLAEAAQPGPWDVEKGLGPGYVPEKDGVKSRSMKPPPSDWMPLLWISNGYTVIQPQDVAFIAAARQDVPALADAVLRLAAEQQWRPIESAPKDGTRVLLFYTGTNQAVLGRSFGGIWQIEGYLRPADSCITHWLPLPPAPEAPHE